LAAATVIINHSDKSVQELLITCISNSLEYFGTLPIINEVHTSVELFSVTSANRSL